MSSHYRALQTDKLKAPLFFGPVVVGVSDDWYINHTMMTAFTFNTLGKNIQQTTF